jgi:RNA polymerase sigma-70 factor (ECF subfamily)
MLERWVTEHQPDVYRAAYLILRDAQAAEDVAQETFIRGWRAAGSLPRDADLSPWLHRIAVNLSLNRLRSAKRERAALERMGPADAAADDLAERRATRSAVSAAIRKLPERLRVPVILRYFMDWPEREVARALRIRPGTVKSRLHEARTALAGDESIAAARDGTG